MFRLTPIALAVMVIGFTGGVAVGQSVTVGFPTYDNPAPSLVTITGAIPNGTLSDLKVRKAPTQPINWNVSGLDYSVNLPNGAKLYDLELLGTTAQLQVVHPVSFRVEYLKDFPGSTVTVRNSTFNGSFHTLTLPVILTAGTEGYRIVFSDYEASGNTLINISAPPF